MTRATFLAPLLRKPERHHALQNETSGETVAARVEPALTSCARRQGLLGRDNLGPDTAFIIAPSNAVHTFGMRFPIDLLFVSRSGEVVKRVTALKPRRIALALRGFAVVEFCANHPGVAATRVGDRLRVEKY